MQSEVVVGARRPYGIARAIRDERLHGICQLNDQHRFRRVHIDEAAVAVAPAPELVVNYPKVRRSINEVGAHNIEKFLNVLPCLSGWGDLIEAILARAACDSIGRSEWSLNPHDQPR